MQAQDAASSAVAVAAAPSRAGKAKRNDDVCSGTAQLPQLQGEFKLLGKNSLDEMSMATPAVANGSLIIRTANTLYRFMAR